MRYDGTAKFIRYGTKDGRTLCIPTDEIVGYRTFSWPDLDFPNNFGPNLFGRDGGVFRPRIKAWQSFERDNPGLIRLLKYTEEEITGIAIKEIERIKNDFRSGTDADTDPVLIELAARKKALLELHMPALYTAYRYLQYHEQDNDLLTR